jgi:hypothetical protein
MVRLYSEDPISRGFTTRPASAIMGHARTPTAEDHIGEMRASGVRGLMICCSDYRCSHSTAISADRWPDVASKMDRALIARKLKRTVSAIETRTNTLNGEINSQPTNEPKKWTPEEDERLRNLVESNMSIHLVAAALNRSAPAVEGRASILKLSLKRARFGPKVKK